MRKLLSLTVLFMVGSLAAAQTITPTTGTGRDALAKGENEASVNQTVQLTLPRATALHLDVTELNFDLTQLNGTNWNTTPDPTSQTGQNVGTDFGGKMICIYGNSPSDVTIPGGSDLYDQIQTLPLGTAYLLNWPNVTVGQFNGSVVVPAAATDVVTSYPPIRTDATTGELVPGSKNHFVCYRTFILQKFSNAPGFRLTVNRNDANKDRSIAHLYIQDNPCYAGSTAPGTGLYELPDGQSRNLIPKSQQQGTTGYRANLNNARCGYKSWLDDLVVMAVKVNADKADVTTANLTYTLTSFGW